MPKGICPFGEIGLYRQFQSERSRQRRERAKSRRYIVKGV